MQPSRWKNVGVWALACTPGLLAIAYWIKLAHGPISVERLAKWSAVAAGATVVYLAIRVAICRLAGANKWVPRLFDLAFAIAYVNLLFWAQRWSLLR